MKLYKIAFIVFINLSLFLGACTEDIDLAFNTTYTGLVVNGAITTDTTSHKVVLSKSGDPLNKEPLQYISDATVFITDGIDTFKLTESTEKKGVYETQPDVFGVPGRTYKLNVSNVDINNDGVPETYTAQSLLKNINPIDSISVVSQVFDSENKGWLINLYSLDIGGGRNYYLIKVYKNGTLLTDSLADYSSGFGLANNAGFEGKYYYGLAVYYLDHNKVDERLTSGDVVTLELNGITEDHFNFIDGYIKEYVPKNPIFSGPSANVPTNIEPKDKASGFFAAYSVSRKSSVYK